VKLISMVTHRGEREAVLAVLEEGGAFLAPVFDAKGDLIAFYEGDMKDLGELVGKLVTGLAQSGSPLQFAAVPRSESDEPDKGSPRGESDEPGKIIQKPAKVPHSKDGGPVGITSGPGVPRGERHALASRHPPAPAPGHDPEQIIHSRPANPRGVPTEIWLALSELVHAHVATLNLAASLVANLATDLTTHGALKDASTSSREEVEARRS